MVDGPPKLRSDQARQARHLKGPGQADQVSYHSGSPIPSLLKTPLLHVGCHHSSPPLIFWLFSISNIAAYRFTVLPTESFARHFHQSRHRSVQAHISYQTHTLITRHTRVPTTSHSFTSAVPYLLAAILLCRSPFSVFINNHLRVSNQGDQLF